MGSEIEITETPNWLKELEAKRERRLKTKLGHELGAGAPCLTCEEKCPGLDLHFWRKICKNCKCSKENHEVQDDDIYGWAQDELLGTKVNRLKRKIVLPGRKEEVELEWTPNGQKETIDKYLKTLPAELLPIKGSQAAQDRKQLLKKQIPIHDIDPTLCHELTDEELKKMQEYIAHVKQSSVGIGHLIQISFNRGKSHILDKNDAMFLINNVPKGIVTSENILLQSSDNSVSLRNFNNLINNLDSEEKVPMSNYLPNTYKTIENGEQIPVHPGMIDKHYNVNDFNQKNTNSSKQPIYDPQDSLMLKEDIQFPQDTTLKSLNYPENYSFSPTKSTSLSGNSNIKNLVPSAFVPVKHSKEMSVGSEPHDLSLSNTGTIRELPYPSQFINEKMKYKNLSPYIPVKFNQEDCQNPAFFEPIKDTRYPPSHQADTMPYSESVNEPYKINSLDYSKNSLSSIENKNIQPQISQSLGNQYISRADKTGIDQYSNNEQNRSQYYPMQNSPNKYGEIQQIKKESDPNSEYFGETQISNDSPQFNNNVGRNINQNNHNLPHVISGKINLYEDKQKSSKIKNIRDLAYSTYDSPPDGVLEDDFNKLSVKEKLNKIEKGTLPTPKPIDTFGRPENSFQHNQSNRIPEGISETGVIQSSPFARFKTESPVINQIQSTDVRGYDPNMSKEIPLSHRNNLASPRQIPYPQNSGRNAHLPSYISENKSISEDDLHPSYIPIGSIRDIEYQNPEIRTALSKDNDLFEGSTPNKFAPNLDPNNLPSCHYCKEKFAQDDLAIAIPERSDAVYHTGCFKCHGCNQILADMFYFYDKETDNIFCGRDYAKIRGIPRCGACDELIFVKEYCLAENSTFHVKHFCCFECDKPLAGQNYVMENDQPVCVPCYELTKANKCFACKEVIHPDQQGLQLKDGVHFHATEDCFACKVCKKPLFGAKLLFRKDCLFCSHDCFNSVGN